MLVGIVIIFYLYKSTLFYNIRKAILYDKQHVKHKLLKKYIVRYT